MCSLLLDEPCPTDDGQTDPPYTYSGLLMPPFAAPVPNRSRLGRGMLLRSARMWATVLRWTWLLGILLLPLAGYSQTPPALVWQKALGGSNADYCQAVTPAPDGGFVVAGYTSSYDKDVTGTHGGYDAWVVKLDASGNKVWQKALGGSDDDQFYAVTAAPDGGFVVAGSTNSNNGDVSGNHGSYDFWVVKLDASGNKVWQKTLGGSNFDEAHAITTARDGGFVVTGSTSSNNGDVSGNHGNADLWVVKLDASGNLLWQKALGGSGTGSDEADGITLAPDGGFVIAGSTQSRNGDVTSNQGGYDFWVIKLDASGNKVWQKTLGGSLDDQAYAVTTAPDGGFVAVGYTSSSDGDVPLNQGGSDYWVIKLDASGNVVWQRTLGGRSADQARGVTTAPDGGFVVAGLSLSGDGDITNNIQEYDYWVVKLDASGNKVWQKNLGGRGRDQAYAITKAPTGGYVIAGITGSTSGDVTGQQGSFDYWVAKLGPEPPTLTELITQPDPVCAGQPVQFTTRLGNTSENYSYTLTNGAGSYLSGTASSPAFSQTLTASGSGTQSFTLTVTTSGGTAAGSANLTVIPTSPDYQPLADLYASTGGTRWARKDNWLTGCSPCGWYGVSCDANGRVTALNLPANGLDGTIPVSFSALTALQRINLSSNKLKGNIPASLSVLTGLQQLNLSNNVMEGSIPASLSALTSLQVMNLSINLLSGSIPSSLGNLTALQTLNLFSNQLTGSLPASLGGLPQLQSLLLITNHLSGCFPNSYTALCGKDVSFSNNPGLPGGGDFGAFCTDGTGSCTPANTAPVATANVSQTATVGQPFSYTVNAFTDAQTPTSLTYTASISPANGLVFDTATRIITGTPSLSGVSTVNVTATDPGGLTASTSFSVTVSSAPVVVTPLVLTLTASPTMILTTGTTSLSATASGGTGPYRYRFSGPGTIAPATNTAQVSNLSAGVQTFTVVVSDASTPASQTASATVSVTVNSPSTPPPTVPFALTGVSTLSCTPIQTGRYSVRFSPQYGGLDGSPVSFSVVSEKLPTTEPGPYTLSLYTDNPLITLSASQGAANTTYRYNWLAACTTNPAPNTPPRVVMALSAQSGTVGVDFRYVIPAGTFTDSESPNNLQLSAAGLPPGLSLSGSTISGVPSSTLGSPFSASLTATDPGGLSVSTSVTISVAPSPVSPPDPGQPFALTGVTTISCMPVENRVNVRFTPSYGGANGQPITFEVVNETSPTTQSGPYSLSLYRDNPVIILRASQPGSAAPVTYRYEWVAACAGGEPTSPPPVTPPAGFTIGGVNPVNCEVVSAGQRRVTFTPQYAGLDGSPVSFSVVNEKLPTTEPGPYTLTLYTDNPAITLSAQQGSSVATYRYNWLAACSSGARLGARTEVPLSVVVLGNPIQSGQVVIEVRGAEGQPLRLQLSDERGRLIGDQLVGRAGSVEKLVMPVGHQSAGVLLLRVSTSAQVQTLKLLNIR